MAEEVQKTTPETVEEVILVPQDVPQAEKTSVENKQPPQAPETEEQEVKPLKPVEEEGKEADQESKSSSGDDEKEAQSGSFKEESTKVADLPEAEKKALEELKQLVREALNKHEFIGDNNAASSSPPKEEEKQELAVVEEEKKPAEEKSSEAIPEDQKTATEEPAKPEQEPEAVEKTKEEAEKVAASDDDGAKTVEAIEETIVSVCPSSVPTEQQQSSSAPKEPEDKAETKEEAQVEQSPPEEISIWGIPLLADERSDVILLKFLRARDFKVKDAFTMLKNTIRWRKEFGIDELLEEDFGDDLDNVVFMHGFDKEGHPVCYNVYGEFRNKELYQKTFSDEEKRQKFLRWRIQFLEKSIRKLDFTPGGISTVFQVNDLKNSPGAAKWELRQATKQALQLLQDNYPEFVAKQVFINVPWWYMAVNRMISPFLTQRTKSKFVFAGPSKSAEALFRYIAAQQVPVKYGGLSKEGEFGADDAVTEITVKPAAKHTVEFPANEACHLTWEVRVMGRDVSYGAEFVPSAEDSYTVIIQKNRKIYSTEEPVVCNSFKIGEPGKVILTINNSSSKKKKLLYRLKTKPSSD